MNPTANRVGRVTVQVDDLAAATADFAVALGVPFTTGTHPVTGVPMASSVALSVVGRGSGLGPSDGPLAEVEMLVTDLDTVAARLASIGLQPQRAGEHLRVGFHGIPLTIAAAPVAPAAPSGRTRFDRIVLVVDDVHRAAADLAAVFDIHLQTFDVDNMRIRVGLGESGIELIAKLDPVIEIEALWHGLISGYAIQVDDIDVAKVQMQALGVPVSFEFVTPGGMLEVFYGRPGLHGVPLTLIPYHEDGSLLEAMGIEDGATNVAPEIRPQS